jgi:hypothetical protein
MGLTLQIGLERHNGCTHTKALSKNAIVANECCIEYKKIPTQNYSKARFRPDANSIIMHLA